MFERKDKKGLVYSIKSSPDSPELKQIVVRAWDNTVKNEKQQALGFIAYKRILISSTTTKILLSLKLCEGKYPEFSVLKVDDPRDLPTENSLYTYSFYSLIPDALNKKYIEMQKKPDNQTLVTNNAERFLVTVAWEFLSAMGMNKLIQIKNAGQSAFFSSTPDHETKSAAHKIPSFYLNSVQNFACSTMGLLAIAKLEEKKALQLELSVPGETRIIERGGYWCSII